MLMFILKLDSTTLFHLSVKEPWGPGDSHPQLVNLCATHCFLTLIKPGNRLRASERIARVMIALAGPRS